MCMNILKRVCAYYITRRRSILFIITIIIILRSYPLCACANTRRFDVDGRYLFRDRVCVPLRLCALHLSSAQERGPIGSHHGAVTSFPPSAIFVLFRFIFLLRERLVCGRLVADFYAHVGIPRTDRRASYSPSVRFDGLSGRGMGWGEGERLLIGSTGPVTTKFPHILVVTRKFFLFA